MLNPEAGPTRRGLLDHVSRYDSRRPPHIANTSIGNVRRKVLACGPEVIYTRLSVGYSSAVPATIVLPRACS